MISCPHCGEQFNPKTSRQKFCCEDHAYLYFNSHRNEKYNFICQNCGNPYSTAYSNRDKYCSRSCFYEFIKNRKETKQENNPVRFSICLKCGNQFEFKQNKKYCSSDCRRRVVLEILAEERIASYVSIECKCKECGLAFTSTYKSKHRDYCSYKCLYKYSHRIGRDRRRARLRSVPFESIDRQAIYERDGFICQLCGEPVDISAQVPSNLAPTLDHVFPLSLGGHHTVDNVQCAHFICNCIKGSNPTPIEKDSSTPMYTACPVDFFAYGFGEI
jgi:5-methylcytosine-specific restriction endonuclease McrA